MKRWRVYFTRAGLVPYVGDHFMDIEGELLVDGGVLGFYAPYTDTPGEGGLFRVIKDYADCFAINADGEPLRPA